MNVCERDRGGERERERCENTDTKNEINGGFETCERKMVKIMIERMKSMEGFSYINTHVKYVMAMQTT